MSIKKLLREGLANIYEGNVKSSLSKGSITLFETVKDYYKMSGDHVLDAKNINELHTFLKEDEEGDFDPFGHGTQPEQGNEVVDENICYLTISKGNSKLDWPYLSLPAGYTCPMASVCKSFASKPGKKFSDGSSLKAASDKTEFGCYAARAQAQYPAVKKNAFTNLSLLMEAQKSGGIEAMTELIVDSIKHAGFEHTKIFRIHEGGDFFSDNYFKAWIGVANALPNINFYTHTTSLKFWIANKGSVPNNMNLNASMQDDNKDLIIQNDLRYSKVVYSVEDAKEQRLRIDYDDSIACCSDENFALLIHGGQPKGSDASKAVSTNKKSGHYDKMKALHKANKPSRQDLLRK